MANATLLDLTFVFGLIAMRKFSLHHVHLGVAWWHGFEMDGGLFVCLFVSELY